MSNPPKTAAAAQLTAPKYRQKKLKHGETQISTGVPKWDGTKRGHEWLHLTLHHVDGKWSFPVCVMHRDATKALLVEECLKWLERVNTTPQFFVADKEFIDAYDTMAFIDDYARPRNTWVIGPVTRRESVRAETVAIWDDPERKQLWRHPEDLEPPFHFHCQWYEPEGNKQAGHYQVYVYVYEDIRPDLRDDLEPTEPLARRGDKVVRGICFRSNFAVGMDDIRWFTGVYARRWACESLFARHIVFYGGSQAQEMRNRHFGYASAFLVMGVYALWSAVQRRQQGLKDEYPARISNRAFTNRVHAGIERRFVEAASSDE